MPHNFTNHIPPMKKMKATTIPLQGLVSGFSTQDTSLE
jgi:hypothetical protein